MIMIRRVLIAVLVVLLLAGAFLLMDFRVAQSNTQANTTFGSGTNNAGAPPQPMPVYVWIEEKDSLSTGLRDALVAELVASGRFNPQVLPAAPKPTAGDVPLLRVWVERPGLSWTPFYAQADMLVRFGFSTYTHEISFEDDSPITTPATPWALYGEGNVNLVDRSFGLISLRGYWSHLGQQAAEKIVAELVRAIP